MNIPASNRKVFGIAFVVALIALVVFIFVAKSFNASGIKVDKDALASNDPSRVFDMPTTKASLYYIDLEKFATNASSSEAIGCGDGLVAYEIPVGENLGLTKGDAANYVLSQYFMAGTFDQLKGENADAAKQPYNALAQSSFSVESLNDIPVLSEVRLKGQVKLGGVCDGPRAAAQLEKTIQSIFSPSPVKIFINDKPIAEIFSEK